MQCMHTHNTTLKQRERLMAELAWLVAAAAVSWLRGRVRAMVVVVVVEIPSIVAPKYHSMGICEMEEERN